ncbi:hypothetical protein ABXN37_09040 [Piscinibacter sakaiensis]|uniref:Putative transmembrane protein n=1 Tax=Piscinibacter sakaiensis TaxID=1547922 RepID=A0A0K8NY42_PISS1|nr:hypothetical protein [Piscinibacter sakaiensis]GAP35293.1 putative transmembrane protein [Piscinibacter sakaiensis]
MSESLGLDEKSRALKTVGHVSYLLHTIVAVSAVVPGVQASVALLIVAFIIDVVKKDDALGTWQESHFRWRIRSVLWAGGLYLLTAPLWLLLALPGLLAWAIISIWFLYRVVRGWLNLNGNQPMPT